MASREFINRGTGPDSRILSALDRLHAGRQHDRDGRLDEAVDCYEAALTARSGRPAIEAETLRLLAVVRLHQGHAEQAKALCQRSIETSRTLGDHSLTAMGLNTYGGILFEEGQLDVAKAMFEDAQSMAATDQVLAAKIEQNLGIIANVQGMWSLARSHYEQSLEAFERLGDERGAAVAHHNLGMISADREEWDSAKGHYNEALRLARQTGEVRLEGLCRLNHAEALLAGQMFGQAQEDAEAAFALFHRIGSVLDEADGCRVLGLVFHYTGRPALAETYLTAAVTLAIQTKSPVGQAEASRDLGILCHETHRCREAFAWLTKAQDLFREIGIQHEAAGVGRRLAALEA